MRHALTTSEATLLLIAISLAVTEATFWPDPALPPPGPITMRFYATVAAAMDRELRPGWEVHPPEIELVDIDRLREVACPGSDCRPLSAYRDGTIYLREDNDLLEMHATSILAHEMVHHLQHWTAGGPATDCKELTSREEEANAVQSRIGGWPRNRTPMMSVANVFLPVESGTADCGETAAPWGLRTVTVDNGTRGRRG